MATGGSLSRSVLHGSDEVIENPCSICIKDGDEVESVHFCNDCQDNLCRHCSKWHDKFHGSAGHHVVDISKGNKQGPANVLQLPTDRCQEHLGKIIDTYCADHDIVCCATCVAMEHRACDGIKYLPKFVKGVQTDKSLQDIKTASSTLQAKLTQIKLSKEDQLKQLDNKENENLKKVMEFRKGLIKRIENLTEEEITHIKEKHQVARDDISADIKAIEESAKATEACSKNLNEFKDANKSQLFVYIKTGEKNVQNGNDILQHLKTSANMKFANFIVNLDIEHYMNGVLSIGKFELSSAQFKDDYDIKVGEDESVSDVTGSCLLSDGRVLLADHSNKKLKLLNLSKRTCTVLEMPGCPFDVCSTGRNEVAVIMYNPGIIQFVDVADSMRLTRSFRWKSGLNALRFAMLIALQSNRDPLVRPIHICYRNGELFVAYGDVSVFDMLGNRLRTISTDSSAQHVFSSSPDLTTDVDGNLYVSDESNGIIVLDRNDKVVTTFTDTGLNNPRGLCILDNGDIVVCDLRADNVILFSSDGSENATLLSSKDGIKNPISVLYDRTNSYLIVTFESCDVVKVFALK